MGQLCFPLCQPHPPWAGVNGVSVATYCQSDRFFTRLRRCEPPPPQDVFFEAEGPSGGLRNCASGGPFGPGLPVARERLRSRPLAAGPGRKSAACGARAISDGPRRVGGGSHRLAGPVASNCPPLPRRRAVGDPNSKQLNQQGTRLDTAPTAFGCGNVMTCSTIGQVAYKNQTTEGGPSFGRCIAGPSGAWQAAAFQSLWS